MSGLKHKNTNDNSNTIDGNLNILTYHFTSYIYILLVSHLTINRILSKLSAIEIKINDLGFKIDVLNVE